MNYKKGNVAIAASIVVAGLIVAGAVMFTNKSAAPTSDTNGGNPSAQADNKVENVNPVDENDWVYGNPDAEVTIVEYSDTECPFCARLHPTLKRLVDEYDGQVNWVYRHFPVKANSPRIANAQECVGELAGNDAFWTFTNKVYEESGNNGSTDLDMLPEYAEQAGVDVEQFNTCVDDNRHSEKVRDDRSNAIASGGTGTPFSVIISGDQKIPFSGARPYEQWVSEIDQLLQ